VSPRLFILAANVVVSGLLTADPAAPTAKLLDMMLAGSIDFVVSVEFLAEYRRVLLRPKVSRRHGLSAGEVDVVLERIAENAIVMEPTRGRSAAPDSGDQHVWDLLEAAADAVLVTGDALLLSAPPVGRVVRSPRDCLSDAPRRSSPSSKS
jgi:putative PIN family toxin of toxin-antitoxin system